MPFVWSSAFEVLKEQCSAELLRITGAKAIDWKLTHSIATLKRVKKPARSQRREEHYRHQLRQRRRR
ncbi:putative ATP-binding protein [Klebsiella variicola]|nr:putative ATP-binding protein [Klebsiella variicola]